MTQSVFTKALEPYILRLNVADNAVAVGLVFNALEDPGVFVFGEILDHPRVQALKGYFPSGNAYYQLLKIFAFGCFRDYLVGSSKLPSLTPKMVKKLRMLTIVTLATKARVIKYCELQRELNVNSTRELEDLIIDAMNYDIIKGKLDQKNSHFEVQFAFARDLKKSEVCEVSDMLQDWQDNCADLLMCLEDQVIKANELKASNIEHKSAIEKRIGVIQGRINLQPQASNGVIEDPDSMDGDRDNTIKHLLPRLNKSHKY